jgi:hypothetical protein
VTDGRLLTLANGQRVSSATLEELGAAQYERARGFYDAKPDSVRAEEHDRRIYVVLRVGGRLLACFRVRLATARDGRPIKTDRRRVWLERGIRRPAGIPEFNLYDERARTDESRRSFR